MTIEAELFDVTACHGYKWLCSPRGAGFITATEEARTWLKPVNAGWYSGDDPWQSLYGPPLRLAPDARAFNSSPAWFSYAAAVPALEALAGLGPEAIGRYSIDLANLFREKVGLDISNSTMVSLETNAGDSLKEAGVAVSSRDGRVRFSFYLYNTVADVEMAAEIVREAART
jgi:selenocysteine lyase/cysteine desulfurase